jgi:hypothetical protein
MAKLILRAEFVQSVGKAYERNTQTNEWYFEVFSAVDGEGTDHRNRLAEVLLPKSNIPLKGDVLVVKNGPENGNWQPEFTIEDLAGTLWWYHMSGRDVSEVFGEREMERFIRSLE